MEMILSPKCLCPVAKLLVVHGARKQLIESLKKKTDRIYLNALDNQVVPDSETISLNYLPDNVPFDAKFTLNQTVYELQVQAKH